MGTRHLTVVVVDGQHRVAQYGQWDGYPSGQGETVAEFIQNADMEKFKEQVRNLHWITDEEMKTVNATKDWPKEYPYLSRDAGAKILKYIYGGLLKTGLQDEFNFAGDSLFCEFAYVLDLDRQVLEFYKGFNQSPVPETNRFAKCSGDGSTKSEYTPIALFKEIPFAEIDDSTMTKLEAELNAEDESED